MGGFYLLKTVILNCGVMSGCQFSYINISTCSFPGQFYSFTVYMVCVNSIINPFVYAIQYHEFQQRIKELFFRNQMN